MMNLWDLFGGFLFGTIGFAVFLIGKKQASWRKMAIGILLMVFPYFVQGAVATYVTGSLLVLALFIFRD